MKDIKLFLTDVDGCLTDGGMYYGDDGAEYKRFCVYDGAGMVLLQRAGIPCGIITGEDTKIVENRARKLHLQYLFMGVGTFHPDKPTKLQVAENICAELGITLEQVCYVGDDINDIDLLQAVGHPYCPQSAQPCVLNLPNIKIVPINGGQGVIRHICNQILAEK